MNNKTNPQVAQYMSKRPCVVDEGLSLSDAMDRMLANDIRHLVVVRGQRMVGVVDASDLSLTNAVVGEPLADVPVTKAMRGLFSCPADMPLTDVVRTMEEHHFGCVAVVRDNELVGIFTNSDALRALREIVLGHDVQPLHGRKSDAGLADADPEQPRQTPPPRARARRLIAKGGAAPTARDGMTFGTVGL